MKPTIRSIAERAGVSRGTVDKVLNDRVGVSDSVRKQVKSIADAMGYQPNPAGKALAFQRKPVIIGVVLLSDQDPVYQEIRRGIEAGLQEYADMGLRAVYRMLDPVDPDLQAEVLENLRSEGVSALIVSPLNSKGVLAALQRYTDQGIPIIMVNTAVEDVKRLAFVGQDLIRSGRIAGNLMNKLLQQGEAVAILSGSASIRALRNRVDGFKQVFENTFLFEDIGDNDTAFTATMKILKEYESVKGIYLTGKGVGGAGRALKAENRDDVRLICFDASPETFELLHEGWLDFTITQEPFQQGKIPIQLLFEFFFRNRKPENPSVFTQSLIITKENIPD